MEVSVRKCVIADMQFVALENRDAHSLCIIDCQFVGNMAVGGTGGALYVGAILSVVQVTISDSVFQRNQAAQGGGGVTLLVIQLV